VEEEKLTLPEVMLAADRFCCGIESRVQDIPASSEMEELRLKLAQARSLLCELQAIYNRDELTLESKFTRGMFRNLGVALMWVAYYARGFIDRKLYRSLVMVEFSFTYLLSVSER
jgi:hypothetical protein